MTRFQSSARRSPSEQARQTGVAEDFFIRIGLAIKCLSLHSSCTLAMLLYMAPVAAQSSAAKDSPPADVTRDAKVDEEYITIECEARIERQLDYQSELVHFASIESPPLEASKKYKLNIRLLNPTDAPIRFDKIASDCGCSKYEVAENEIPALGFGEFVMKLDVPNRIHSNQVSIQSRFMSLDPAEKKPTLILILSYELTGSFNFANERVTIEIPKNEKVVVAKVPLIVVPPLKLSDLELKSTENLRDMNVKMIVDDPDFEGPYAEITVARENVEREMLGELILRRRGTKHATGVLVNIRHQAAFTLRPESLRLSRDNHSKPYEATAILRISKPVKTPTDTASESNPKDDAKSSEDVQKPEVQPEVALSIGGKSARVQLKPLGGAGVYRVMVRFDGPVETGSDDTLEVRWRVVVDGVERVIDSHAFVPQIYQR